MILHGIWGPSFEKWFQPQILSWYVKKISTIWGTRQEGWISRGWSITHLQYFEDDNRRYHSLGIDILIFMISSRPLRKLNEFYGSFFTQKYTYFVKEITPDSTCTWMALYTAHGQLLTSFLVCILVVGGFKGRVWAQLDSSTDRPHRRVLLSEAQKWYFTPLIPRVFLPNLVSFFQIRCYFADF